jgi:uncharacterized membrane protein YozB (DUF420 family)
MNIGGGITNLVVPPLLEQESLMLIFVALGLGIVGMAFGRIKNKDSFQMHRWIMTGAVALNLIAILVVMLPSLVFFYINPDMNTSSSFSILQIVHSIVGFPAFTMALIFAFNDLPKQTKKWMITTAILWFTSIALGAIVYFTMPN